MSILSSSAPFRKRVWKKNNEISYNYRMPTQDIQNIVYFGLGKPTNLPESILKLYTELMEKMHADKMTSKEQSIIMLELSQTIKSRFQQKYPNADLSNSAHITAYSTVCTEVLNELLSKTYL